MRIVCYPDPVLRQKAEPILHIDAEVRELAEAMTRTMYANDGVGLAAPQVGVSRRLVIVDDSPERDRPRVLINPVLTRRGKRKVKVEEGCLSLPGINAKVARPAEVTVEAQDLDGEAVHLEASDLLARALQHEIDHLDGVLFVDKVAPTARFSLRAELDRLRDAYERETAGRPR